MNSERFENAQRSARDRITRAFSMAKTDLAGRVLTSITFDPNPTKTLNFTEHCKPLEYLWPGCSCAWDSHDELRTWARYTLAIVRNRQNAAPIGAREARHHIREAGHYQLVGYHLMPSSRPYWLPMRIDTSHRTAAFTYFDHDEGVDVGEPGRWVTTNALVRAIYNKREERWVVIR